MKKLDNLERIADNIFLVRGKNGGRFPYSHSILIASDNGETVLIDTGCGVETLAEIKRALKVSCIINSHTHPDHSAGNWIFKDVTKAICVPVEGFKTSGNMVALSERLAEPGWLAEYWKEFVSKVMNFKDCKPTSWFNGETSLKFGEVTLLPIYTPGHTIDHYSFYEPDEKILFSFDYDLTSFGPWYGHRESSVSAFKKSIDRLKELHVEVLVPGHREIITHNIKEQLDDFCSKLNEREDKIFKMLGYNGKTISELVEEAPIYGKFPYAEPLLRYWEGNMIKKHLEELITQRKVVKIGERYTPLE